MSWIITVEPAPTWEIGAESNEVIIAVTVESEAASTAVLAAAAAAASKLAAQQAETNAETAQGLAETAATASQTAQGLAEDARAAAIVAKDASELAATASETAQGLAESASSTATTQAGIATTQAGIATTKADEASASASSASASASTATTQAGIATTQATNALNSANAAAASASAAAQVGTSTLLTGYTVGGNTAIAAGDTILQAFGKVQGQINARVSGTIATNQVAFGTGINTIGGGGLNWDNGLNTLTSTNAATFLITTVNQALSITTTGNGNVSIIPNGTGNIGLKASAQSNSVVTINGDLGSGNRSNAISFSTARWFNIWHEGGSPRIGVFVEGNTSTNTMKWTHPSLRANYLSFSANFLDFNFTNPSTGIGNDITGPTALIRFDYANQRQGILTISPTNTLDVNGTARVRTRTNGGTTFAKYDALGVLNERTNAQAADDALKAISGWNASVNQELRHDTSGNLLWVNI